LALAATIPTISSAPQLAATKATEVIESGSIFLACRNADDVVDLFLTRYPVARIATRYGPRMRNATDRPVMIVYDRP
jgi:hypothetical protein